MKWPLFLATALMTTFYLLGAYFVFQNQRKLEEIERGTVNQEEGRKVVQRSFLHDSAFYRAFAEKLTYFRHDPTTVERMYGLALQKAPSAHEAFLSYASYLVERNCCAEQVRFLLQETVRRCPTHPRMNKIAAAYFIHLKEEQRALPFIRKSLEMDPGSALELFRMMDKQERGVQALVAVTPDDAEALLQLAVYLAGKKTEEEALQQTFTRLQKKTLTAPQRLRFAELAWRAQKPEIAGTQAMLASQDKTVKAAALALQVRMLLEQQKLQEALKLAEAAEMEYRTNGGPDEAVRYALSFADQLQRSDRTAAKEKMLRILNDYPSYAPAYSRMAQFIRQDSKELELFYLKKARDLAPDNAESLRLLAIRLLEAKKIPEAETAYGDLLRFSGKEREALHGLADCRIAAGDRPGAIQFLQQAVQRGVTSAQTFRNLGQLYGSVGEYERSALTFLEYAKLTPGNMEGLNFAGDAYMNLGRYPYARDLYRRVLTREPQNAHAQKALKNLELLGY